MLTDTPQRLLRSTRRSTGYIVVTLFGPRRQYRVPRLVLEALVGPCPADHEAAHEDGNRHNNRLNNLSWKTKLANAHDKVRHGTTPRGDRNGSRRHPERLVRGEHHGNAAIHDVAVRVIRLLASRGVSPSLLARAYKSHRSSIHRIVTGRTWAHVPYLLPVAPRAAA